MFCVCKRLYEICAGASRTFLLVLLFYNALHTGIYCLTHYLYCDQANLGMRVINVVYRHRDDLIEASQYCQGYDVSRLLVQVFAGDQPREEIDALLVSVRELFGDVAVLGATSGGEICDGQILERHMLVSIALFDRTQVQSAAIAAPCDSFQEAGKTLADTLFQEDTRCAIFFCTGMTDGVINNAEPLLNAVASARPDVVVAGGQAADYEGGPVTRIFTEKGVLSEGVAAVALSGDSLRILNDYNLGWVPVGRNMQVTQCDGSRVAAIDNRPVADLYKYYLGEDVAAGLPMSAVDFPLIVERSGVPVARHGNKLYPDGSMDFMSHFEVGDQVRFAYCHAGLIESQAAELAHRVNQFQPQAIFLYSCVCRKWALGGDVYAELTPFSRQAPTAGFFSYGEFFHRGDDNVFLTQTMTALVLSESPVVEASGQQEAHSSPHQTRHFSSIKVLHHLIEQSARELEAVNVELEAMTVTDHLTGVANKRKLLQDLDYEIRRARRTGRPLTLLMIDVDHFKQFNDRYGHVAGDRCLQAVAQVLAARLKRPGDLVARFGGEEFCCLMPLTDNDGGSTWAEYLRREVACLEVAVSGEQVSVTVSIGLVTFSDLQGVDAEQVIECADQELYRAKSEGRNCVCARAVVKQEK